MRYASRNAILGIFFYALRKLMMQGMWVLLLAMTAGIHAACYGAYKDAPYEFFRLKRFIREIIIATLKRTQI
jgi:hypothetical protein